MVVSLLEIRSAKEKVQIELKYGPVLRQGYHSLKLQTNRVILFR